MESGLTAKGFLGSAYYVHVIGNEDVTNIINNKPSMNDNFTVNNVEPGATPVTSITTGRYTATAN